MTESTIDARKSDDSRAPSRVSPLMLVHEPVGGSERAVMDGDDPLGARDEVERLPFGPNDGVLAALVGVRGFHRRERQVDVLRVLGQARAVDVVPKLGDQ